MILISHVSWFGKITKLFGTFFVCKKWFDFYLVNIHHHCLFLTSIKTCSTKKGFFWYKKLQSSIQKYFVLFGKNHLNFPLRRDTLWARLIIFSITIIITNLVFPSWVICLVVWLNWLNLSTPSSGIIPENVSAWKSGKNYAKCSISCICNTMFCYSLF